jgi:hypothetical protein
MLVGSSVTSLTLHEDIFARVPRYDLLFDRLTQKEAATRLRTLTIKSSVNNLSQFFAATSRLHELSVEFRYNSNPLSLLLISGVRRNASLHSAVWTVEETEPPSLYLRQVLAYCERNKMVPKLLVGEWSKPRRPKLQCQAFSLQRSRPAEPLPIPCSLACWLEVRRWGHGGKQLA